MTARLQRLRPTALFQQCTTALGGRRTLFRTRTCTRTQQRRRRRRRLRGRSSAAPSKGSQIFWRWRRRRMRWRTRAQSAEQRASTLTVMGWGRARDVPACRCSFEQRRASSRHRRPTESVQPPVADRDVDRASREQAQVIRFIPLYSKINILKCSPFPRRRISRRYLPGGLRARRGKPRGKRGHAHTLAGQQRPD